MGTSIDRIARALFLIVATAATATTACGGKVLGADRESNGGNRGTGANGESADEPTSASGLPAGDNAGSVPPPPPGPDPEPEAPSPPLWPVGKPCGVSFSKDVLSMMVRLQCTNASCHGGASPPSLPRIDASSPGATRASLVAFVMSDGRRYVVPTSTDPQDSGILCNLDGTCGVRMPLGASATSSDLTTIETWLACGAPDD